MVEHAPEEGETEVRFFSQAHLADFDAQFSLLRFVQFGENDGQEAILSARGRRFHVYLLRQDYRAREIPPEKLAGEIIRAGSLFALHTRAFYLDHIPAYGNAELVRSDAGDEGSYHDIARGLMHVHRELAFACRVVLKRRGRMVGFRGRMRRVMRRMRTLVRQFVVKRIEIIRADMSGKAIEK